MADIALCAGWYHPECQDCLRRLTKPAEMWQSYINPPRESPCPLYLDAEYWRASHGKPAVRSRSKQQS
jgi:hypothetical protein